MAKGPGQGDAFLHLPAAQVVPAEAQEERYAGLLGRGLLPCAREVLPEPPLSAGIKAGKGGEPAESPAHPAAGRGYSAGTDSGSRCSGSGGDAAAGAVPQPAAGKAAGGRGRRVAGP